LYYKFCETRLVSTISRHRELGMLELKSQKQNSNVAYTVLVKKDTDCFYK